ncbi:hypothetical protein BVY03_04025 [bacterium K02(2017)]|nr:hypothetical protein BVY03_04025 [bacterium K02(2017)]
MNNIIINNIKYLCLIGGSYHQKKNIFFSVLSTTIVLCCFFASFKVQANLVQIKPENAFFKQSLWESEPIPQQILSLAYGKLTHYGLDQIIYCTKNKIVVGEIKAQKLVEYFNLKAPKTQEYHRLSMGDWNQDGNINIIVNGFESGRVFSDLYQFKNQKLILVQSFDNLVMPLKLNGKTELYNQKWFGQGEWEKQAHQMIYNGKRWVSSSNFISVNNGLGRNAFSLFDMVSMGNKLVYFNRDASLLVSDLKGKKIWKSSLNFGGAVDYTKIKHRDPLGLNKDKLYMISPRMAWANNQLYVFHNQSYINSVVGTIPQIKTTQFLSLKWKQQDGFQESFRSQTFQGALTDVRSIDFDGDGQQELLVSFIKRKGGYLGPTHKKQSSRIAVLKLK